MSISAYPSITLSTYLLAGLFGVFTSLSNSVQAANRLKTDATIPLILSEEKTTNNLIAPLPVLTTKVIQYFEKALDSKFEINRYPWKRALENAISGEGLIYGVSITKERALTLAFSEAIFTDQSWLVTRCDATFSFNKLTDLRGKVVGMVRGGSAGEEFDKQANVSFTLEDDTGATPARFAKLFNHRMDALIYFGSNTDSKTLSKILNQRYGKNLADFDKGNPAFCVLPHAVSSITIHFALAHHLDQSVLKKINRIILKGRSNGSLARSLQMGASI